MEAGVIRFLGESHYAEVYRSATEPSGQGRAAGGSQALQIAERYTHNTRMRERPQIAVTVP